MLDNAERLSKQQRKGGELFHVIHSWLIANKPRLKTNTYKCLMITHSQHLMNTAEIITLLEALNSLSHI